MRHHFGLALALALAAPAPAQPETVARAGWVEQEIAVGVRWKAHRFASLFGAPQCVNVLVLDLREREVKLRFAAAAGKDLTSVMAQRTRAVGAVNGGFFDVKTGAPVGLLKIDGKVVGGEVSGRDAALRVTGDEAVGIEPGPGESWSNVEHALVAGPILVVAGKTAIPEQRANEALVTRRHPRTAVGVTANRQALLVTVDGRAPEVAGMTCPELAELMIGLGVQSAMNLDGGGSTAMWVRGEPQGGIVSYPCDDLKFDHAGERKVANAVLVLAPDIVAADDARAELAPPALWSRVPLASALDGSYSFAAAAAGASATFLLHVELPGTYELQVRWPRLAGLTANAQVRFDGAQRNLNLALGGGAWHPLERLELVAARAVSLTIAGADRNALAIDAVRLVERR